MPYGGFTKRPSATPEASGTSYLTEARKAVAAASGAAAEAVALGLLSGTAERWTTGVLAAVTAGLVYLVPNGKAAVKRKPAPAKHTTVKPAP